MATKVVLPGPGNGFHATQGAIMVALDVQYVEEDAYVALEVREYPGTPIGVFVCRLKAGGEYVPGFFAFREGPVLKAALELLQAKTPHHADFLLVDGHGTAHPRKFGVACWLGLETGLPTLGCAKETLVKYEGSLEMPRGSTLPILVDGETCGLVLRTVDGIRPVFVSPGHQISQAHCVEIILATTQDFRISEPLRSADSACRAFAKGEKVKGMVILDELP